MRGISPSTASDHMLFLLFRLKDLRLSRPLLGWAGRCSSSEAAVPAAIGITSPRRVRHGNATFVSPRVDGLRVLFGLGVNTNVDGGVQAILNLATDEGDLHDWIVTTLLSHVEECILGVLGLSLLVGIVGRGGLDPGKEVLLDIELADMRNGAALDGVICKLLSAVVDDGCSTD